MKPNTLAAAGLLWALSALGAGAAEQTPSPRAPDREGIVEGYRGVPFALPGSQLQFVKKGDFVDLLATFDSAMEPNVKEKVTATIIQYVRVVDVFKPGKMDELGSIEILLNPHESQYLALSLQQGSVQLLIRAPGDKEMKPMEMASLRKLFR